MNNVTKIFLLDDHKIIRDGIRSLLSQNHNYLVVGEEGDPLVFLKNLNRLDVDILLLDITFPQFSGIQLLPRIKSERPELKIVILSMHKDPEYMQRCLLLGAQGYISKDSDSDDLIKGLNEVRDGKIYFKKPQYSPVPKPQPATHQLSNREIEILRFLAHGLSSKQIASELSISTRTVETHRLNIMKKLKTSNSAETVSVASRMNLL